MTASLVLGSPRFTDTDLAAVAKHQGLLAAWKEGFLRHGVKVLSRVQGDFAIALRLDDHRSFLAVDRFAIRSVCYRIQGSEIVVAERADEAAGQTAAMDSQALFDYLYFHCIPAPRTVFKGVCRLPAGHYALFEGQTLTVRPWWTPSFEENQRESYPKLRDEFRGLLRDAVSAQLDSRAPGCFLSGGTDSSTVAGLLTEITGKPARTFSIGFQAEGYDEMEYARIAARHFKAEHHEYYVTPDDLVRSIPSVAASYDQPFGNSSVLPAYYCAKVAREAGIEKILAGDGGDELFGGNTRYAKQRVFGYYDALPGLLRRSTLEPMLMGTSLPGRIPGLKKAVSYVEQARVPMPDRMQTYNLLMRLGLDEVLTSDFLRQVDTDGPMRQQREVYASAKAGSLVNRMLAYDWRYTLAENDLPKVIGATTLADLAVGFPLLDDRLVDFSMKLEPNLKLRGLKLRWFFKEALRGFLPDEILAKKKHGFGLPFGVWTTQHAGLKDMTQRAMASLRERGIVRATFLDRLVKELMPNHPGYYGEMLWILIMLEHWLAARPRLNTASVANVAMPITLCS